MRRILRHRPSPALAVATIALFVALGGTGYALTLPANSVGSAQIQAGRVLNSKLHPGSVSNTKMGRGAVTFSKMANNQMTAAKIRNASLLGEDLAPDTVTGTQIDETTLKLPATKFAIVTADGKLGPQDGGVTVSQPGPPVILDFGSSQAGRPISVTLAPTTVDPVGQVSAAVCGGPSTANPNGVVCPTAVNDTSHVQVNTADKTGTAKLLPFSISIPQA
ncbi:MAG: hypothetical protein QOE65_1571 [Solirubrobacteraceae bacterium]|jgi:hypothetical protein|nr:hypothetical protein [Solirubrobacteraceae bacterium]